LGSLSGTYFCDENRDGLNNDAAPVEGVLVELLDAAGNPTGATATTDAQGNYSFGDLAPGSYGVKFTDAVTGKTLVTADANGNANDNIDSDAADLGNGMSQITGITVVAGQDTPNNDAGVETVPGSLSGTYFCDDNDRATTASLISHLVTTKSCSKPQTGKCSWLKMRAMTTQMTAMWMHRA